MCVCVCVCVYVAIRRPHIHHVKVYACAQVSKVRHNIEHVLILNVAHCQL